MGGCANLAKETEEVFREQNRVTSELLLLLDESPPESPRHGQLSDAEEFILQACMPLNQFAIRYRDNLPIGPFKKLRLPKAIKVCRRVTEQTQALLNDLEP
ncbi:MAG: hypothetical protein AAF438_12950 [Pseudomonadota bacterium]